MELESMTALELAAKIRQREVSVLDGVKEVFDQIESKEDKVHAYLDTYKKEAYARAKEVEKGIQESLVMVDSLAFIVNVPNKTVVTAMDQGETEKNVFTNIDGAVIA